jgi:hypothetical protein
MGDVSGAVIRLRIADCGLRIADCGFWNAESGIAGWRGLWGSVSVRISE